MCLPTRRATALKCETNCGIPMGAPQWGRHDWKHLRRSKMVTATAETVPLDASRQDAMVRRNLDER